MNKKIISMAVAAALVAPVVAQAADLSFKGDARFRTYHNDANGTASTKHDNRVRFVVTATDGDNMATARLTMDGADNAAATASTDYAYVGTKIGPVSLKLGDQRAYFGTNYLVNNAAKPNRVTAMMKAGPATIVIADDVSPNATPVDNARVSTGVIMAKVADFNVSVLSNETTTMIAAIGKAGPVKLAIESTDLNGVAGTYINVGMEVAGMDMGLTSVAMDAGLTTASLYSPVAALGTSNNGIRNANELTLLTVKKGNISFGAGTVDAAGDSLLDVGYKMGNTTFSYSSIDTTTRIAMQYNMKF
ncbi:MAG: hypothetical protein OEX03_04970 [Gammaproteobacteria bacterium]|nr:hypothetical protein [Gammaproteobacteria bacterium]